MAQIKSFGSFASGLYLPVGDMDLVAVSPKYMSNGIPTICQKPHQIRSLGSHLQRCGLAAPGSMSFVLHAKVPLVKFIDNETGIRVDLSFENDSGLIGNRTIQEWKDQYKVVAILVPLIKQLLAMRGLNEVFTGGLGGFSIVCLVVSMLQNNPQLMKEATIGELLLNFLDLYGNKFDIVTTGIRMKPPHYYFDKIRNPSRKQNAQHLTIIDPNNSDNDISGGTRNIRLVLQCFSNAYADLQRRLAEVDKGHDVKGSILGSVLRGNYSSFIVQRRKLSKLFRICSNSLQQN